jgi:N,N-dimethylformamidase beta subunit-like protein
MRTTPPPSRRAVAACVVLPLTLLLVAMLTAASASTPLERTPRPAATTAVPPPDWVVTENAKPGTTAWRISSGATRGISGYANRTSANLGQSVTLYVDTNADSFRVRAYRLGYYDGLGGRLIWTSPSRNGVQQPRRTVTAGTNMVEARWSPSITFSMGSGWVQGNYLFKLVSSDGGEAYVPFVLRDDTSRAPLVLMHQVTTWLAYNTWGGYSLYKGRNGSFETRSRVASFDRPYGGRGANGMLTSYPFVSLVEKAGMDVTYWTDIDLQMRSNLLSQHDALISLDHDEYWSREMRDNAIAARANGLNIAFLGANAIFRKIRFESSPLGVGRRVVNYKLGPEDPLYGVDDPATTPNWRADPVFEPETLLLGAMYECNPVHADMVVVDGGNWVFSGAGLGDGAHIPLGVEDEYDSVHPPAPTPSNIQILAHSPVTCGGESDFADMTYYTTRSDAGVLDVGSQGWVDLLRCGAPVDEATCDPRAVRITKNILNAFAVGPAGIAHPAHSNLADFGIRLLEPIDP